MASVAAIVLGVAVYVLVRGEGSFGESFRAARRVPLGIVIGALVAGAAWQLDAPRGYVWALVALASFLLPHLTGTATGPWVLFAGLLISAVGLFLLLRFLQKHPVVREPDEL